MKIQVNVQEVRTITINVDIPDDTPEDRIRQVAIDKANEVPNYNELESEYSYTMDDELWTVFDANGKRYEEIIELDEGKDDFYDFDRS